MLKITEEYPLIPIVVGIVGHRNLRTEDKGILRKSIQDLLIEKQGKYPSTPFVMLSSLAEGADRLAAEVAIESKIPLLVPLPMPAGEYEKDFKSEKSIKEFRDLLEVAAGSFVVDGNASQDIQDDMDERERRYFEAGVYIARQSQILIALWDGNDLGSKVGTSQIVKLKQNGLPDNPQSSPTLDPPEAGHVYHIVTPRDGSSAVPENAFSQKILYPEVLVESEDSNDHLFKILENIDTFNKDVSKCLPSRQDEMRASSNDLIPRESQALLSTKERVLLNIYAAADTMANMFQAKSKWAFRFLLFFVVIGFVCFQLYLELFKYPQILFVYPAAVVVALSFESYAERRKYQARYLDYRAIAEGLRVSIFWRMAGITDDIASNYLSKQRSELDWIRQAIRNANILALIREGKDTAKPLTISHDHFKMVMDRWVNNQRDWFKKRNNKHHLLFNRWHTCIYSLYYAGIAVVFFMLLMHSYFEQNPYLHHAAIISIAVSLALASVVSFYLEKVSYEEHFKQYNRMQYIFKSASKILSESIHGKNYDKAKMTVLKLGKEALIENGDWVLLHRSRPTNMPKG